jgi:adenylate cyclase
VLTTLGDPANVATRLEQLCKTFGCEAVLSEQVCRVSGLDLGDLPLVQAEVRGLAEPVAVRTALHAAALGRTKAAV